MNANDSQAPKGAFHFSLRTGSRDDFVDITARVRQAVADSGVRNGLAIVFVPHTTAGVTINENADPDVRRDMTAGFGRIVRDDWDFRHSEGNSPAHIKASMTGPSLTVIVENGDLILGTWQGIYFCEFDGPRTRRFVVKAVEA